MLAVFVNCIAVIAGSIVGCLFTRRITEEFSNTVQNAAGIVTMVLGIEMALKYNSIICIVLSLILGGILGTWIDIDGAILKLGGKIEKMVQKKPAESQGNSKNFAYAFLNASVLFCVGAMAILGSFEAGIRHDYTIIFTKSVLDGFMAIVFAASMGIGTIFSALSIFVYQGVLTLLSSFIAPYINDMMLTELSACGGVMIIMIGLNLLRLCKIKTANYLPALLIVVAYQLIVPLFG